MLLHGFPSAIIGKTKHRPVKLKTIQPICILMCILTIPEIAHAAKFEYKAVFSAPCVDIMTFSTPLPELTTFTGCTYIKLASSGPWTAFTYKLPTSSIYEFGVLGDSSSLEIWMFGTQINVFEKLNLHTWYEMCIMWDGKDESMGFYLDGTLKVGRKLKNKTKLAGGGNVILGCSNFEEINASVSVGLVGEIYMFRMWNIAQTSLFQKCNDGNIIKWQKDNWIYMSHVVQEDSTLHCAKEQSEDPTSGQINNNIHMFHKRSIGGPISGVLRSELEVDPTGVPPFIPSTDSPTTGQFGKSTGAAQVDRIVTDTLTSGSNTLTSGSNTFSEVETRNITNVTGFTIGTSRSSTLWKSSGSTNVDDGNYTFSNSSTFSTSSVTTNINNGGSSDGVTSEHTDVTSEFNQITNVLRNETSPMPYSTVSSNVTGSMNCSFNDTSAFENWQTDICNGTCDYGSAYEIILKDNCAAAESLMIYLRTHNYNKIEKDCRVLVFPNNDTVLDICNLWNNYTFKQYIQDVNKIDYYCSCHEECSSLNCITSTRACPTGGNGGNGGSGGSGVSITTGFQSTTFNNSGLAIGTTVINRSGTTVYSGPSATSTKGSSTTFKSGPITTLNISNSTGDAGLSTTIDVKSNTTIKSEVTLTVNSKSKTTLNSESASTNDIGSNGTTTTINSQSNTTSDKGTMTTINSGPVTTINSESRTTLNTVFNTTANNGITRTYNTTLNTGPMSTNLRESETTTNNQSLTITSYSSNNTTKSSRITDALKNLIDSLNSGNLNSSSINSIVSQLEDLLSGEVSPDDAAALLSFLDLFLNVPQVLLGPVSNRLIKIVDKIGLQLNFPGQSISLTTQSLALAVNKVNDSSFTGTSFGVDSSSGLQVSLGSQVPPNSDGSVLLPASLINDLSPGDKNNASRVQFNYYAKTSFFTDSFLSKNQQLVSKVISSSVANLSVTNLSENITVTLKTSAKNASGVECVFWDFTKNNGSGGWSPYGCLVANTSQSETVCKCNHLTSFAVLMNVSPNDQSNPKDLLVLTFITYIGCGLSAIFLSVTLVTYIAFEKIRRDYPSKILIQLCAALVCLNLTFLLNPWIALYNDIPGLCISVAAFLHYFVLVSITWMGLEAFHMYLSLVKVFNTYVRKYILKFCIIGWGAPAVVVAIILAVNKDLYSLKISGKYPNGSADYFCWVDNIVFWITIVGYFAIIFLLNVSMFVVVLIQLCRIKKQKQLGYQRKTTLQDLRSVAGITFLLGITWGLGFFAFGPGRTVIMYLFTIFNSLQGFFIFFFYCVAKENVRKQWRRYLCCGKLRLAENSDWSKTATNKLRKQASKQGVSSSSSNSIQSTSNTNSTTLLVSNEYSMHLNGNGSVIKERNGVSFMMQNGEMPLQELSGRPCTQNGYVQQNSLRRTSTRGSVHFVDQI